MRGTVSRLVVAVWFVGMVVAAVRGVPVAGQAPTEAATFLPLISRHAPLTSDPLLRNYVGLMEANGDDADPDYEIYTIRGDGSEPRRLTDNDVDDTNTAWSADGAKIAFLRSSGDIAFQVQPMLMNADGSEQQPIMQDLWGEDISLKWAPVQRHLLVQLHDDFPTIRSRVFVVMADGTVRTLFDSTTTALDGYWGWSPDGNYIHYTAGRQLHIYSFITRTTTIIEKNMDIVMWLPDSSGLVYDLYTGALNSQAYFVRPDGSGSRELFDGPYNIVRVLQNGTSLLLQDSPTGRTLFTLALNGEEIEPFSNGAVWLGGINPTGTEVFYWSHTDGKLWLHPVEGTPYVVATPRCPITGAFCALNSSTVWATDGSKIIYELTGQQSRESRNELWIASLTPPIRNEFIKRSEYSAGPQYLPLSSTWVGFNPAYGLYTPPISKAFVLDSNDNSTLPLSVSDAPSQQIVEWRYMP